ncbi:MAG TPA: galactose oxidase-like domain-containing protein [Mycobacteriales bacterium]|jgi:hypothetical protein|nr:galactose oxidase-like domain-containing protein [Mycobacteriales bacterium]
MRTTAAVAALLLAAGAAPTLLSPAAQATDPSVVGVFSQPFEEAGPRCAKDAQGHTICKPAGVSTVALADGTVLYWDGLEGMEDVRYNTVLEIGDTAQDDLSRVLDLRGGRPRWSTPTPKDASPSNAPVGDEFLPVVPHNNDRTDNDNDLFCADQVQLADGRVLTVGGTGYYLEPGVTGVPYGLSELEGLKATRLFDPATRTWRNARGHMTYGRWYPSLVTLPDGKVLVTSGVTKLIKPMYPDRPADSGTNVKQTETFDPATETWTVNPASADRSLPLFPRLHLLPDGKVYYDAAGQTFNPMGQSYDEALWNMAAVYDPATKAWTDLGLPQFGPALKGFRGSGFSQQLTLRAPYTKAEFLSAGGVYGVTPGTYVGTDTSTLNTVDTAAGDAFSSVATGPLRNARWYSTGVTLPTGQVLAFSGADRDEVDAPGSGAAVTQAELFDPATRTWTALASGHKGRTYHNTAILLPDGRVLVGGHAPINTGYAFGTNAVRSEVGLSDAFRDPSFEVFTPPNLFYGPRPVITDYERSQRYGTRTTIDVTDARDVASVVLVRNPALTHLIDGDQKVVELPIVGRDGGSVTVATPPSANVAPAGPYWLFVNKRTPKGLTPSVSRQVFVGAPVPAALAGTIEANNAAAVRAELGAAKAAPHGKAKGHDKRSKTAAPAGSSTPAKAPAATVANHAGDARAIDAVPVSDTRRRAPYALLALTAAAGVAVTRRRLARR